MIVVLVFAAFAVLGALMEHWKLRAVLYFLAHKNIQFTEADMEKCLRQVLEHQFKR